MTILQKGRKIKELAAFKLSQLTQGIEVPSEPHFDPDFAKEFGRRLPQSTYYVEFGAGGSTILAGRLGISGYSVESDRRFADAVRGALPPGSKMTISFANIGITGPWGVPMPATPTDGRVKRWMGYVSAPFDAGCCPDLVLVDGRFRRACALASVRNAQVKGMPVTVMLDDYFMGGRDHYTDLEAILGKPQQCGRGAVFESQSAHRLIADDDILAAARDFR